jgi:hypothetical protein
VQAFANSVGLLAPRAGKARKHLESRRRSRRTEPQLGRRPRQACKQKRKRLGFGHAGELGAPAGAKLKPTLPSALAPQRHAGSRQLIDVAKDGSWRHFHLLRKCSSRHTTSHLQQHQNR